MGDFPAWDPNKQLFDQSQMSNPYSQYSGSALPWPTPYNLGGLSAPTDAKGNPIASYQAPQATQQWVPGTTINSSGGGYNAGNPYNIPTTPGGLEYMLGAKDPWSASQAQKEWSTHGGQGTMPTDAAGWTAANQGGGGQTTTPGSYQTVQPSAADQAAAYINALGTPGKVTTQGATVAPSAAQYQPSSGVLDAYLANNKTGGFADTINALRAKRQA